MKTTPRDDTREAVSSAVEVVGLFLVTAGSAMLSHAVGFIVAGIALVVIGYQQAPR